MSPLVFDLQWRVISVWFQRKPDTHRRKREIWRAPLATSLELQPPEILLLNLSGEVKQSPGRGEICIGAWAQARDRASPGRHDNCHHGHSICGLSHLLYYMSKGERKKRPLQSLRAQRSFGVIMAHFSAEIAGNSASEK